MSVSNGPNVPTDDLQLYVDAGNTRSYPGSGNYWLDLSNSKTDGAFGGTPTHTASGGGYFSFDGSTDFIDFGAILEGSGEALSDNQQQNTVSYFARATSFSTYLDNHSIGNCVFGKASTSFNDNYEIGYNSSGQLRVYIDDKSTDININSAYFVYNAWHHVSIVYDASLSTACVKFYVDGILRLQTSTDPYSGMDNADGSQVNIGNNRSNRAWFTGDIGLVMVHGRALSANEVFQVFQAHRSRYGI